MNKVFLVTSGSYSDYHVDAAFSNEELAKSYVAERDKAGNSDPGLVEEFLIDEEAAHKCMTYWRVVIRLKDGALIRKETGKMVDNPSQRVWDWGTKVHNDSSPFRVASAEAYSFVSEEHALKVASELRQGFLRSGLPLQ